MTKLNLSAMAAAVLIFISSSAFAEMANGTYNHDFTGETQLWDISGSYSDAESGLYFTLTEDPSGVLPGTGTYNENDSSGVLSGPMTVIGRVSTSGKNIRVFTKFLITGSGTIVDKYGYSHDGTFTATENVYTEIDTVNGQLVTTGGNVVARFYETSTRRKITASGRIGPGGTLALPVDSTGGWNLTLNLTPNVTKYDSLASTAAVDTSTGGEVDDFKVTGNYTSRTDTSKITLKRIGSSLNLVISTAGSSMTPKSVNGKLYGQTVKFTAP